MTNDKKPKNVKVLDIRKITTKKGEKKDIVQFAKGVKIFYQGYEIDLGEYGTLFVKRREELEADLDFKLEQGWIDEDRKQQSLDYMEEKNVVASVEAKTK